MTDATAHEDEKLAGVLTAAPRSGFAPWQLRVVVRYLDDERVAADLRMSELVELTRLNTSQFSRVFKRTFGKTFSRWIIERRLALARSMMLESDSKLSSIAAVCGFADQSHFNRLFRREMGCPPLEWRRANRVAAAA